MGFGQQFQLAGDSASGKMQTDCEQSYSRLLNLPRSSQLDIPGSTAHRSNILRELSEAIMSVMFWDIRTASVRSLFVEKRRETPSNNGRGVNRCGYVFSKISRILRLNPGNGAPCAPLNPPGPSLVLLLNANKISKGIVSIRNGRTAVMAVLTN